MNVVTEELESGRADRGDDSRALIDVTGQHGRPPQILEAAQLDDYADGVGLECDQR